MAQQASGSGCVRVTTQTSAYNDGYLSLLITHAAGSRTITDKGFSIGSSVINECFDGITSVQIKGPNYDGWTGIASMSKDSGLTFFNLMCPTCAAGSGSGYLTVDLNGDSGNQAGLTCLDGKWCSLQMHTGVTTCSACIAGACVSMCR